MSINMKLARAQRHFGELVSMAREYLATTPYVVRSRVDPLTNRCIYFLAAVQPTPSELSAVLGDTVHNLRCSLDHLAYQLVWLASRTRPGSHVYFPIAESAAAYRKQRDGQLKGASPTMVQAIDGLKP